MSTKNKYYLIHSGPMLDAVKAYIESRSAMIDAAIAFCKKMGADSYFHSGIYDDYVTGLCFKNNLAPEGWLKPNKKGYSRPKANSPDFEQFNNLPKSLDANKLITELLDLTLALRYEKDSSNGVTSIGNPFVEVGFMWLSFDGPYAFWLPDIEAACKYYTDKNYTITNGIDKWKMQLEGVEEISKEKWQYLVAKAEFEKAEAANV